MMHHHGQGASPRIIFNLEHFIFAGEAHYQQIFAGEAHYQQIFAGEAHYQQIFAGKRFISKYRSFMMQQQCKEEQHEGKVQTASLSKF